MNKCYTISGLKSLEKLPEMYRAQFTLNGRVFPSNRKTVRMLEELSPYHFTEIIIHYDFIYIASRYSMLSEGPRKAVVNELASILNYSVNDPLIKGVVMHTDFPIRKGIWGSKNEQVKIQDTYAGSIWNTQKVADMVGSKVDLLEESVLQLFHDVVPMLKDGDHCPIFLETAVSRGPESWFGTTEHILDILNKHSELKSLFGLCIDTEHVWASSGDDWVKISNNFEILSQLKNSVKLMFHVNTIPENVERFSGRDKHSFTTIYEDSVHTSAEITKFMDVLDSLSIPYVREVKEETMYRELNQLTDGSRLK